MITIRTDGDEAYFDDEPTWHRRIFDGRLLEEGLGHLPARAPLVFSTTSPVRDAMRAMQHERRGCVLVTEDGTPATRLIGIFTDRDVLFRVVDRGRNPAVVPLKDVMTPDPETVADEASIAWVLNQMAVGGYRHVPVVDAQHRPVFVISVRDVVQFLVEFFPQQILNLPPQYRTTTIKGREGA